MTRRNWMFRFCSLLLVPAGLFAQSAAPAAPATPQNQPTQKILIHVDTNSPENWQAALKKANDLMASSAKPYDTYVEILATGDGLKLIDKSNPMTSEVSKSLDKDVSFVACHASMKTNHMEDSQLATGVGTVPSGGREITARKAQGWTILEDKSIK
jgi:intracellular sulfur oxidation DsrE/DsrF family protein